MTPGRTTCLVAVLLLVGQLAGASETPRGGFDRDDWMQGANGLFSALRRVDSGERPLVVYFYVDWCRYCRQFESVLLGTARVQKYLDGALAVMINPEHGAQEQDIARYYGGAMDDGQPYLAMELVEGETLRDRVDRLGRLPWETAVETSDRICQALAAAHQAGVVHRRLTPARVMLTKDNHVKLIAE